MTITIDVQYASTCQQVPEEKKIIKWAREALAEENVNSEFTVRIVDENEILELNRRWRGIDKTTNVLAFPAGENTVAPDLLGDIVICAPVILREAGEQNKQVDAHWAHIIIHGLLHLLGHDHARDKEARVMEEREIEILKRLNFPNPYDCKK